jgi:hypothetical protein
MNLIDVDVYRLENLKLSVLDEKIITSYVNMGRYDVSLRKMISAEDVSDNAPDLTLKECASVSSDFRRRVAEVNQPLLSLKELPKNKVVVEKYKFQASTGRVARGQKKDIQNLIIYAGGDSYHVPLCSLNGLTSAIDENKAQDIKRILYIWREDEVFRWEFGEIDGKPCYQDNGKTKKASDIPCGVMQILEFGEESHCKGGRKMWVRLKSTSDSTNQKYYLPMVMKELMNDHLKNHSLSVRNLEVYQLERTGTELINTLPSSKHPEPPIIISGGCFQARNHQLLKRQHAQPSPPPQKRARFNKQP